MEKDLRVEELYCLVYVYFFKVLNAIFYLSFLFASGFDFYNVFLCFNFYICTYFNFGLTN